MDWGRYLRVIEVEHIQALEARLEMHMTGKGEAANLTPDDWEQIAEHERLIEVYGDGG